MNLTLSFPDLFLFTASTVLLLTIILLLRKINTKNNVLIGTLAIYFGLITTTLILILLVKFKFSLKNSFVIPTLIGLVFSLHNVLHYLSLKQLISKTNHLKMKNLIHFLPILVILILIIKILEPINSINQKGYSSLFETQHLMLTYNNNYILGFIRVIHPLVYIVLGGYLMYLFYKSPQYPTTPKSTQIFIFFLYFQKIILMFWFLIGLIGFNIDIATYSNFSITGFSISALVMSSYILLNPSLFLQITKANSYSKKPAVDTSKTTDLLKQLNHVMSQNQLYLDSNYNLTNLSADTDISANTIREVITANGFKNYSAYINSFRITHAENLITNRYLDTYSIESLCKDSGFQSEVTFYRVFKKIHQCTPKEYSYSLKTNEY